MTTIARIETFMVPPRWLFVRVETHDGVVGWGESVVEGRAATVRTAVDELAPGLIGRDSRRIEDIWQESTRSAFYRGGPVLSSAIAGIDQALWDVEGRRLGVSVYELLGGHVRDRVRVYGWVAGDRPDALHEEIAARLGQGLDCVKLNASSEMTTIDGLATARAVVERAEAVREAIGDERDFALDFHGRCSPPMARRLLPLLEHTHPLFVEEPTVPELAAEHLPRLVEHTSIPIAVGERAYSRWDFAPLMATGIAVAQPDVAHCGGISEMRRIAAHGETHGVSLAPHCPLGPIALAACIQVDLASPNFLIQEQSGGIHYNADGWDLLAYVVDTSVFEIVDGHVERPNGPGLGIEVDEDAVRAAARVGHDWHSPVWRHRDGSLAEW